MVLAHLGTGEEVLARGGPLVGTAVESHTDTVVVAATHDELIAYAG